jgi:hypothetical protein
MRGVGSYVRHSWIRRRRRRRRLRGGDRGGPSMAGGGDGGGDCRHCWGEGRSCARLVQGWVRPYGYCWVRPYGYCRTARSHMPCHCDAAASHSSHAICDPPPLDLRPPSCSLSAHMHMRIAPPSLTHARTAMRAQSPVLLHSGAIAVRPYESTASKPYSTPYAVRVTQHTDASRVLTRVFSPTGLATAPRRGIGDHVTPSHSRIQNPVL